MGKTKVKYKTKLLVQDPYISIHMKIKRNIKKKIYNRKVWIPKHFQIYRQLILLNAQRVQYNLLYQVINQ